jgi:hypothetical protein
MNLIGIVATIVVAIAEPVGLNASRRRVSSRAAPATDAMTNRFAAVAFVLAAIAVLIPIAHLSLRQGGNVEQFDLKIQRRLGISICIRTQESGMQTQPCCCWTAKTLVLFWPLAVPFRVFCCCCCKEKEKEKERKRKL